MSIKSHCRWMTICLAVALLVHGCSTKFDTEDCVGGLTDCDGECVDLDSDRDNCGSCGHACGAGQVCDGGTCLDECPAGTTECGGDCVNLDEDDDNCGTCGHACPSDRHCEGGDCVCTGPLVECGTECVDTSTDTDHCGSCFSPCSATYICTSGTCTCPTGTVECAGVCDTDGDGDGVCDSLDLCPGMDDTAAPAILNPDFLSTTDWVVANGARIDTAVDHCADRGMGHIPGPAVCSLGSITQTICVPGDHATVGPLQLEFGTMRVDCSSGMCTRGEHLILAFNGYSRLPAHYIGYTCSPSLVCFGEAAYGGLVDVSFVGAPDSTSCTGTMEYDYFVDNFHLGGTTSSVCPAPGDVLNGDFSAGLSGWTPESTGTADVVSMYGSSMGHLYGAPDTCDSPRLESLVSIPLITTLPSPALMFEMAAASSMPMRASIQGGVVYDYIDVSGGSAMTTHSMCISPENQGQVLTVEFESISPGTCPGSTVREFWFDNVRVATDSSC